MYKKTTLSNGLRIITIPMKGTKAVTVLVTVGTGSKYETKENNGISHFLEHMSFKGTKKRPSSLEINETIDRIGGFNNAFTGKEETGYWAKADSKYLDLLLDWVSDILLNSKLGEKEIENEKGVIVEELNLRFDTPIVYIEDFWEEMLYKNQPAGWSLGGEKENIMKLKRPNFLDYLKNYYSSKNIIICIAGNINSKIVEKKINKYFKNINTRNPKSKLKVIEKQKKPEAALHFKDAGQTQIALGVRGFNLFQPQRIAQALLAKILGGFMSSRLFILMRDKKGLTYYVRTSSESYTDTGYLVTWTGVDNNRVEEAIKLILKEYQSFKNKKIDKSELQKAKENIKGNLTLSLESSDAQASFYTDQELLTGKILNPEEIFKKVDAVTVGDIQKLAKDIFKPEKLNLALIGPFKNKEKFNKLLKI
ncbi:MAG: pitrilysin family protein [Candidatus Nealsonbacteria bacterium]|nr:pitrilysin family protein [Candidatus Nealsonbacteria bacterium]